LCGDRIVIRTDPKGTDYIVESGGDKKNEEYTAEDAGAMQLERHEERLKNQDNAFLKLEKELKDK
jgi:coiled-coil domain-containing protein 130